jgi:hypothetical protein
MYKDEMDFEKDALRQGDIIEDTQIFGAINLKSITFINNARSEYEGWQCKAKPIFSYAMVLSHSCELDPANGVKLTSIILAPLRDIDTATDKEKIDDLKNSNLLRPERTYSYLKYFFLDPHPKMSFSNGSVVDFSKTYSLKKDSYREILGHKIIQLQDTVVEDIALKYSAYFYRTAGVFSA